MPENYPSEIARNNAPTSDNEIELVDLLRILWKRKYILFAGTAVIVVLIIAISLFMPKMYRSQMIVKPGLSYVNKKGDWVFIDSPSNMQLLVESELIYKLERKLSESKDARFSLPLIYKTLPDDTKNTLTVSYDSANVKESIAKLQLLLNALTEYYNNALQPYLQKYEREIALVRHEIELNLREQEFISSNLSEIQTSLENYKKMYTVGADNLSGKLGRYLVDFTAIVDRTSRLKQNQSKIDIKISELKDKVTKLENEKNTLAGIYVVQPPTKISGPDRTKVKLSLMSSPVIGFFVMVFLVLFIEYVRKVMDKLRREKIFD